MVMVFFPLGEIRSLGLHVVLVHTLMAVPFLAIPQGGGKTQESRWACAPSGSVGVALSEC
jgi:hypothetical protein